MEETWKNRGKQRRKKNEPKKETAGVPALLNGRTKMGRENKREREREREKAKDERQRQAVA